MNYIFKIYFLFSGRISRSTYWLASIPIVLIGMLLEANRTYLWAKFVGCVITWSILAISAKRWHDRDKSGWWNLVGFIPLIGSIWSLVECGFLSGTNGSNRFGGNPLKPTN